MRAVIVQELRIYPLKSARGISLAHARLDRTGLQWDRHWLAIRADGTFLTQRTHPALARIATALDARGLRLRTEGLRPLDLPFDGPGRGREVRIVARHL
ncbi:protein containing MOSC [mine drainage metagenome]|uniref:Protein containing MOSC n=1 Tax=mine drainage metagenome TaxID=410659 RepID=T0Y2G5_9ZZZZ